MSKRVVIIGAGRLGKGFIAETFANSPSWDIGLIDAEPRVVEEIRRCDGFDVTVHRVEGIEHHHVRDFTVCTWKESICGELIRAADLLVFTIYPEQIEGALASLAPHLADRAAERPSAPLSLIVITNKNRLIRGMEKRLAALMGNERAGWLRDAVAIRDSIVRRSTDADSNRSCAIRTTAVKSLLIQQPLTCDVSDVEWFELTDNLEMLKDLKVFIVNGPHAASAFWGWAHGMNTVNEVMGDAEGSAFVTEVADEIRTAILATHPVTVEQLHELSFFPAARGDMVDQIYRVAYDPIRKLSADDRLAGSARLCMQAGTPFDAIARAMAYGMRYDNPEDPRSVALQRMIAHDGLPAALERVTGFAPASPIARLVVDECRRICHPPTVRQTS